VRQPEGSDRRVRNCQHGQGALAPNFGLGGQVPAGPPHL